MPFRVYLGAAHAYMNDARNYPETKARSVQRALACVDHMIREGFVDC